MKVKQWIPIVLALGLGLAALKLTRDRMSRAQAPSAAGANFAERVVATRDIAAGQQMAPDDLALGKVASDSIPSGSFNAVADLKDRVAATGIVKGQPVLESLLAPAGVGAGVQALIPLGMRAITIQVNEFSGVAGLLTPGCRVDIISTVPGGDEKEGSVARTIVQNVEVRAVGRQIVPPTAGGKPETENNGQPAPAPTNVTLLVTPEQAEQVQLASVGGKPWLSLRNATDAAAVETAGTSMADLRGDRAKKAAESVTPPAVKPAVDPFAETAPVKTASARKGADAMPKTRTVTIIRGTKEQTLQMSVEDLTAATAGADTEETAE
jgi:pilus assembly protein CpaB